jgi:hypothetical protein
MMLLRKYIVGVASFIIQIDGQDFVIAVLLKVNSYSSIMQPGGGRQVLGMVNMLTTVVGNEKLSFSKPESKKM